MITKEHISSWLNNRDILKKEPTTALEQFRAAFPFFLPAQYFKAFQLDYKTAPFQQLQHIFPANPVLLYAYFHTSENDKVRRSLTNEMIPEETRPPVFDDKELLRESIAGKDYFAGQDNIMVNDSETSNTPSGDKDLMVVMSFSEWLQYLQTRVQKAKEEEADKKALRTMWQKQKLAAAIEEEDEEIPETVFEMAINSIAIQEDFLSESLAEVYIRQGKKEKALDMYRKLSLQNPEKSVYFARKIELLQKDIEI